MRSQLEDIYRNLICFKTVNACFISYQKVQSDAFLNEWVYVMVTWRKRDGIRMYYNAQLRSNNATGAPVENTTVDPYKDNLVIGREVGNNGPFHSAHFNMASFTTFAGCLSQDEVNAAYIFFWSGRKCEKKKTKERATEADKHRQRYSTSVKISTIAN